MPTFSYKAVNEEGKPVRGTIDAESMDAAKLALEQTKLTDVTVTEAMRLRKSPAKAADAGGPVSYAFEGTAADGSVHRGTIQAESKRRAFDRLRQEQKLTLTMLSPVGVTPQYKDEDLLRWQKDGAQAAAVADAQKGAPVAVRAAAPAAKKPEPEPAPPEFHDIEKKIDAAAKEPPKAVPAARGAYYPLVDTLRLYAGWLMAWYVLFVALGYYAYERELPFDIPIVEGFFFSPLIFRFISAMFIFLALSSFHKLLRGKLLSGIVLTLAGCGLYAATLIYG
jgi:hypothetical protein